MSGSESAVWRDGQVQQVMLPPEGMGPVREVNKREPRDLEVDHIQLTLYGTDGVWSAGSAALHGMWLRKSDGQVSTRRGSILLAGPLAVEDGAPQELVEQVELLMAGLNRVFKGLES